MAECAMVAQELLGSQREQVEPHGDVHHDAIPDFGERGWLAIDPKRVTGECYYVNVLCNPDLKTCVDPTGIARQVDNVLTFAGLERRRLLQWVIAQAALSAARLLEDRERDTANNELEVAGLAQLTLS